MGKKALTYSAGLIALYLVIYNATKSGSLVTASSKGGVGLVKAFQGR